MKEQITKITSNPIGAVVGAGAGYLVATKVMKTDKMWMTIGLSVVGLVAGALVQAKMKAKKGAPTSAVVAK